jgi:hypothetical protein
MSDEADILKKQAKTEYNTGAFLGKMHKKDNDPPIYSDKDEQIPFVVGYLKGYYE